MDTHDTHTALDAAHLLTGGRADHISKIYCVLWASWGQASKDNSILDSTVADAVPVSLDSAATQHAAVSHELPSGGGASATPPATLILLAAFAFTPALRIRVRSPKLKRESPG